MAHAIQDYPGACSMIHGHSYELHVSVTTDEQQDGYISSTGILFDFKDLKRIVNESILKNFDHQLVLSEKYIRANKLTDMKNLYVMEAEPTAENLLYFIRKKLEPELPENIKLQGLKIYETKDSYAEWKNPVY